MLSKYALDCRPYQSGNTAHVTWEKSELRSWLNSEFFDAAFERGEQGQVVSTMLDNYACYQHGPKRDSITAHAKTTDRVFILDYDAIWKFFSIGKDRECVPTEYAVAQGAFVDAEVGTCWWWMRQLNSAQNGTAYLIASKGSETWGNMDLTNNAVRPAIWVDNSGLSTKGYEVIFGWYEQDNNLENGPEPVEWIVLDAQDGKSLLLSKYGLDAKAFNVTDNVAYWESCTLRKWLNSAFLQDTFSKNEQQAIVSTKVDNSKEQGNPAWETSDRASTTDATFLPSYAEISSYFHNDSERRCKPTAFAIAEGVNLKEGHSWWWTRSASSGNYLNYAGTISPEGSTKTTKNVNSAKGAVRPAIWVDQEKLKFSFEQNRLSDEVSKATLDSNSLVTFGRYEQDNNTDNGAEPIEWIVLETNGNKVLLLSRYVLDWKQIKESGKNYTWETSTLRSWLNQEFLEAAFSNLEKKLISRNYVDNSYGQGIPGINVYGGGNTSDSSFILSYAEAQRFFPTDEDRTAMQTEFAKSQGVSKEDFCRWWLRSPGCIFGNNNLNGACMINSNGRFGTFATATTLQGVRPAIWIDLDAVYK